MKTHHSSFITHRFVAVLFLLIPFTLHAQLKYLQDVRELPPHPRILMFQGEEEQIKSNIKNDPVWEKIHQSLISECDRITTLPILERKQEGRRLLSVSREALRRIFYLSYAYRIEGQEKYLRHAEKEMLTISAFSDWNPSHFLDVGEMTMALSIGYDWLYHSLSAESLRTIRTAIFEKGIDPSLNSKHAWFLKAKHNWNQVCNAGMAYGALAVFDYMPEFSKMIIDRAVETIQLAMADYGPDGAYPEGYGYWEYGTSFNVMFLAAIEKALGTDYGLGKIPGFMKTAGYLENMTGPKHQSFNYADNGLNGHLSTSMFWFASKLNDPSLLWNEKTYLLSDMKHTGARLLPTLLLWGSHLKMTDIKSPGKLLWAGQGPNPVVLMRTSWTDPNAVFVGFKGGTASSNHAHMDAGSFVMDADGVRWASDFGAESYHALESKGVDLWNMNQNSQRWQVFRYNNKAHNTLTVDDQLHVVKGYAKIRSVSSSSGFLSATSDLSEIFEGQLTSAVRGVVIVESQYVAVRDEIKTLDKETTVRWTMLTTADAKITGKNTIELRKDGKKLKLQVDEPAKVTMKTWSTVSPNDFDSKNPGIILVGFEIKVPANTDMALTVKLIPQSAKKINQKILELAQWSKDAGM